MQQKVEMYYHISSDGCWMQPAVKTTGKNWIPNIKWKEIFPDHRYQKKYRQSRDQSDWHLHEVCQIRQKWNRQRRQHKRMIHRLVQEIKAEKNGVDTGDTLP